MLTHQLLRFDDPRKGLCVLRTWFLAENVLHPVELTESNVSSSQLVSIKQNYKTCHS